MKTFQTLKNFLGGNFSRQTLRKDSDSSRGKLFAKFHNFLGKLFENLLAGEKLKERLKKEAEVKATSSAGMEDNASYEIGH